MMFAKQRLVGNGLRYFVVFGMTVSAIMKFVQPADFAKNMEHIGIPVSLAPTLGVIELISALFLAVPRTALLGAILAAGYFGGAIFAHLRIGEPPTAPFVLGVLAWVGVGLTHEDLFRGAFGLKSSAP
jgi:uncharacterized membrane protein YphA (DoxX/SURF4 family)